MGNTMSKQIASATLLALFASLSINAAEPAFERTEERAPCANYSENKQPFFGDLHVHTSYSFDSYVSSQRNDPWDAYSYAKGEAIFLSDADANQTVEAKIQRPLDFTAITDHGEFLGQIGMCTSDASKLGYWWPHCIMTRSENYYAQLVAMGWWADIGVADTSAVKEKSFACTLSDCDSSGKEFWNNIQQASEDHYDRTEECGFTTFVGYEYTDAPDFKNMHRVVIYRNENVTDMPITTYETGSYNFPKLWSDLREQCIDKDEGCDVMSIPHNSNLAGGLMFPDPKNQEEIDNRQFFEPLFELTQHKGASECRYDRLAGKGLGTTDELCDFEQIKADNLGMLGSVHGETQTDRADSVPIEEFAPRNMIRNVLKDGLALEQASGENPFKIGFIGSTDSHSATPGSAEENNYVGHLGRRDSGYRNLQDHFGSNPGGLAVVWAEENSRDSLFNSMRNKETYATSGTRPIVRFFGGRDFTPAMCQSSSMVADAYAGGVAMGGDLSSADLKTADGNKAPSFLVSALKDAGSPGNPGIDLQRTQIIKGWVDADGQTHEKVYDIAGGPNSASVNPQTCAPVGQGYTDLCGVWTDPEFDQSQRAFYYVRVLENPSCRWSTLQCQAAGVNPFSKDCSTQAAEQTALAQEGSAFGDVYGSCCINPKDEPFYTPTIQERAWTSPIWYTPEDSAED